MISVIITTRNSGETITKCLLSIHFSRSPKPIEIIVVDNHSIDNTVLIASKLANRVFTYGSERSEQRNYGISKANGEWIMFLDSDMYLATDFDFNYIANQTKYDSFYIPERIGGNNFWIKIRDFERSFYNGTVIDCVRVFRKCDVWFDKFLTGPEDWDFDRRLAGRKGILPFCIYHNEGNFNLKSYLNKKTYYMSGINNYIDKWGEDDPIVKKQLGFWYRCIGVFMEKWWKLLLHPFLTIGMLYLRFRVGVAYVYRER